MHIRQQVLHFLLIERLSERGHLASTQANDLADSIIIGGQAAYGQVLFLENAFEPRALFAARGIGLVALVAMPVVNAASGGLLRVEAEFCIGFSALHIACNQASDE